MDVFGFAGTIEGQEQPRVLVIVGADLVAGDGHPKIIIAPSAYLFHGLY